MITASEGAVTILSIGDTVSMSPIVDKNVTNAIGDTIGDTIGDIGGINGDRLVTRLVT